MLGTGTIIGFFLDTFKYPITNYTYSKNTSAATSFPYKCNKAHLANLFTHILDI